LRSPLQSPIGMAGTALMLVLTACSHAPARIHVTPKTPMTTTATRSFDQPRIVGRAPRTVDVDAVRTVLQAEVLIAEAHQNAGVVTPEVRVGRGRETRVPATTPATSRAGTPAPVSDARCPAGAVKDEIDRVFGTAAPWAESVAVRESHCEPGARNGSSGSAGLFQLLGHDDLLRAACPTHIVAGKTVAYPPSESWSNYDCNIRAAKDLYDAAGIAPWRL
jgi:hypothetical protein